MSNRVRSAAPALDAVVMLVDNAVYVNGQRTADPQSLDETYEVLRERNGMAWIGLYRPDVAEIRSVATEFELHELPVQDAISAHQRPGVGAVRSDPVRGAAPGPVSR